MAPEVEIVPSDVKGHEKPARVVRTGFAYSPASEIEGMNYDGQQ